jgi:hypothetical protein
MNELPNASVGTDPSSTVPEDVAVVVVNENESTHSVSASRADPLTPQQIRRLGALQVEDIADEAMEQFLSQQRAVYEDTSREELIQTLLDRDRSLASEGRAMANGLTGARLLREFVRGVLSAADKADPMRLERVLKELGAPPADARQLRRDGHMLGTGQTSEERRLELEATIVTKDSE